MGKLKVFVQFFYFVFPWNAFIVHQWHPATWWLFIHSQYVPIFGEIFREKTIRKDIQQNILRRKEKSFNGEHWHPGTWWLFIHAPWCPISPHSHCTDCNNLSWLFIQKRENSRRSQKKQKPLTIWLLSWQSWEMVQKGGHHFKVDWGRPGYHHLILELGPQIAKYPNISTLSVGRGICVKFSVSGFRPCMALKLGHS